VDVSTDRPADLLRLCVDNALAKARIKHTDVPKKWKADHGRLEPLSLEIQSPPMADLVKATNKFSLNLYAERLALRVTRERAGLESYGALRKVFALEAESRGIRAPELIQVDGSGLSRYNQATAAALVSVLLSSLSSSYGPALLDSLPIVGMDGTLANKKLSATALGRVRAKSGSLSGQRAWAGTIEVMADPAHPRVVFALMLGNVSQGGGYSGAIFEKFAERVVQGP